MLLSMTGFGRATNKFGDKTIIAEVRSLNSKFMDTRLKVPQTYKNRETELRKLVSDKLERGKIDFLIETNSMQGDEEMALNIPLFKSYYKELANLADELSMSKEGLAQAIIRLPNIVAPASGDISEEEWKVVTGTLEEAMDNLNKFRAVEGEAMSKDLKERAESIIDILGQVGPYEVTRMEKMRSRLKQNLDEFLGRDNVDENRFEQEVLFYIEKMDITEEKVRLEQHCKYFLEVMANQDSSQKGRKLSFIGQEMGREINTLGAKAYSSDIQKLVVQMKDELEKIKEQVANIV